MTAIGPTVDGIIVGMYYDMDSVAAIGMTSFLLEGYLTRQQFSRDPENGFAIRMMMKLSRDIRYTGLYGMNNLIIHV